METPLVCACVCVGAEGEDIKTVLIVVNPGLRLYSNGKSTVEMLRLNFHMGLLNAFIYRLISPCG